MEKYLIESVTVNGEECKVFKTRAGGFDFAEGTLDFGFLALKLPQKLFQEGNEVKITMRKAI
jgi:hypothetical protein